MTILLLITFIILGFLSNLIGILINPISMLIAVPFVLYALKLPYRWGFLFIFGYYVGLFELGPILLPFDSSESPLLIHSPLYSIFLFTLGSFIPYSLILLGIKYTSE